MAVRTVQMYQDWVKHFMHCVILSVGYFCGELWNVTKAYVGLIVKPVIHDICTCIDVCPEDCSPAVETSAF